MKDWINVVAMSNIMLTHSHSAFVAPVREVDGNIERIEEPTPDTHPMWSVYLRDASTAMSTCVADTRSRLTAEHLASALTALITEAKAAA